MILRRRLLSGVLLTLKPLFRRSRLSRLPIPIRAFKTHMIDVYSIVLSPTLPRTFPELHFVIVQWETMNPLLEYRLS